MVWKYRFPKDMSNKLMVFRSKRKKVEFHRSAEKGRVWKEPWVMTQGKREVELGALLLSNDKNNVIAEKVLSYF